MKKIIYFKNNLKKPLKIFINNQINKKLLNLKIKNLEKSTFID